MQQFNKPILLIVFNRIDTTKKVFEQIKKIKPSKLYIASDGPRDGKEAIKVNQVRKYIMDNIDWPCDVKTRFREKNLGVGFGPSDAINWFFSQEEMGIILEDDCLPSLSFFKFCDELLDYYKENKKIGVIQGFNPFPKETYNYSYFFSKYDLKWGWATWKDRWLYFDMYIKDWPDVKTDLFERIFENNRLVISYWKNIFDMIHRNPSLAWDVQFTYQMLKRGLLTIVPVRNLVLNIGYGKDAFSTKWGIPEHIKKLSLSEIEFPLVHPVEIKINSEYDELVEKVHFEINRNTVLRYQLRNFLESNFLSKSLILPVLVNMYRFYKKLKMRLKGE